MIDWGDLCRAEPAIDLSLLWSFFPPAGREAFLEAYGPRQRGPARARAACSPSTCASSLPIYGHEEGMAGVEREALEGLERALA